MALIDAHLIQDSFWWSSTVALHPQRPYGITDTRSPGRPPRLSDCERKVTLKKDLSSLGNSESEAWNVLEVKQASLTNEQTKGGGGGVATRGQGGRGGCWTLASLPCGLISQKGVCLMVPKPRPVTDCSQEQRL